MNLPSDPPVLQAVLDRALAAGGSFAELFVEERATTSLTWDDGRLDRASGGLDRGAGLRVIDGEVAFFANGNDLAPEGLFDLADRLAAGIGRAREASAARLADAPGREDRADVREWPDEVPTARLVTYLADADTAARLADPRVVQVTVAIGATRRAIVVVNSEGRFAAERTPYITFTTQVVARADGAIRSGFEAVSMTCGLERFPLAQAEEIAREAARVAVLQLGAAPAPSGTMPVVLSSRAGGTMVHEACGHGLEADFYLKQLSIYSGRLGQKVAADGVTVIDDGTLEGRRGTSAFDDEGIPAQRVVLIDNGVLVGLLHSRHTAQRLSMAPTGNGRRESFRHLPIPRMRNTLIAPGSDDPDEIIASVAEGLFVARMGGGEVDIVSGNFVFHCTEAYRIRDGRIAEPVQGAILTGNGPAVLASIDRIGRDLGWAVGTCGKDGQGVPVSDAQPTLRIPALVVGGTAGAHQAPDA